MPLAGRPRRGRASRPGPALLLAFGALAALPAAGHDLWLEPSSFRPEAGEPVAVELRLGHPGHAEEVERDPRRWRRFAAVGPSGEAVVPGLDGSAPAGYLRPVEAGLWTLLYESLPAESELPATRFERYLEEEGLEAIRALRRERGESALPGRELYSRSLKCLLRVGGATADADRPRGLPLELVLEQPADDADRLRLSLLYRGGPLAGALVEVRPLGGGEPVFAGRSAADGSLAARLPAGRWLATAVHMVPEVPPHHDWRSYWTALTFERVAAEE